MTLFDAPVSRLNGRRITSWITTSQVKHHDSIVLVQGIVSRNVEELSEDARVAAKNCRDDVDDLVAIFSSATMFIYQYYFGLMNGAS
jgi:hypothetical protein